MYCYTNPCSIMVRRHGKSWPAIAIAQGLRSGGPWPIPYFRRGAKTIPAGVPRNRAALPGPDRVVSARPASMAVWNAEDHLHSRFTGYDVPVVVLSGPNKGQCILCRPSKNALTKPAKQADTPVSAPEDFRHMTKSSRSRRIRCSAPAGWGAGAILAGVPGAMSRLSCRGMIQRGCRGEDHQIL